MTIHDERVWSRILRDGTLGAGEAYVEGWWDSRALDQTIHRLQRIKAVDVLRDNWMIVPRLLKARVLNLQTVRRAIGNGQHHYDIGNDLYEAMLDRSMLYTCALWSTGARTLEAAQEAKLELVCRKIGLCPGMRVLDLGCGWGGFAAYAAERHRAEVVGLTVSHEQVRFAKQRYAHLPVDIRLGDYRDVDLLNSWDVDATTLPALASSSSRCSELAPTRAESRFLRARLEMASGDFGAAVPHLHEATRLNPSFAEAYAALAQARLVAEDNDAALALMERAARLSPHAYVAGLACAQFSIHHYADALRSAQRALETHPGYTFARTVACASAAELGDQALARKLLARIRRDVPGFTVDYLRAAFANQRFAAVDRLVEAVSRLR